MNRTFVKIFILCFCLALAGLIDRRMHNPDIHFSPNNIIMDHLAQQEELPQDNVQALRDIFAQEFSYFNKGSQCYVFISEDQKYVLKLFKSYIYEPRSYLAYIPLPFNPYFKEAKARRAKKEATFEACTTAYQELKGRSGLICLHLSATKDTLGKVRVVDKRGNEFEVDLDRASFQLQRKANLIYPRIAELMQAGEIERAKGVIAAIFAFLDEMGKRGVCDNDPILRKNFGLIDDRVIQLDVGKLKLRKTQTLVYKKEIIGITQRFRDWLTQNYPELLPYFLEQLQEATAADS